MTSSASRAPDTDRTLVEKPSRDRIGHWQSTRSVDWVHADEATMRKRKKGTNLELRLDRGQRAFAAAANALMRGDWTWSVWEVVFVWSNSKIANDNGTAWRGWRVGLALRGES
jgi:hypothetical protein